MGFGGCVFGMVHVFIDLKCVCDWNSAVRVVAKGLHDWFLCYLKTMVGVCFEGIVIKRQGRKAVENFTVRRIVQGVGVERTFPINSPKVDKINVIRQGKVRRAKLFYLRKRIGSQATRVEEADNAAAK